jgi:hypothetical protein
VNKGKTRKIDGEHQFSIEMASKTHLYKLEVTDGPKEQVLIEGELGRNISVELVEGIMLQITGENGVLRIDLSEGDLKGVLKNMNSLHSQNHEGGNT